MLVKYRWFIVIFVALITGAAGLMTGKLKEKDYLGQLYARSDFTLLDDQNEFFQLSKFPSARLLLLIFTPDTLHPKLVKPFAEFSRHLNEFKAMGIDVMMITRTNREIARNFKEAARFSSRLLIDNSGTVGRNIGVWPDANPVKTWGYVLMDNKLQVYWATTDTVPKAFPELMKEFKKLSSEARGQGEKASP
jgi:peroxiredoxin